MRFIAKSMLGILMITSLTACVFSGGLENKISQSKNNRFTVNESKTDNIVAVGKPANIITTHPYALVLVGQKYNYLIEGLDDDEQKSREILTIFEQLSTKYLSISTQTYQTQNTDFLMVRPTGGHYSCISEYGCTHITLSFKKPKNQVKIADENQLTALGFRCNEITENLSCYRSIKMAVTPITKATNQKNTAAAYHFKKPITIKFYDFHAKKGTLKRGVLTALLPLALVVDVVTFPIQAEFKKDLVF